MTLYIKHRPTDFDQFIGNEDIVESLKSLLERPIEQIPHVFLFEGDYGTGKTTLARILADKLGCAKMEMHLIDAGTHRKVESADKIKEHMVYLPISGKIKVYIIDEIQTTKGSKFQESLLNTLEDGCPKHVYFIFCTTDAHKVNKGIKSRATIFHLRKYTIRELIKIQELVVERNYNSKIGGENKSEFYGKNVLRKIAMKADGSPREALTILDKVIDILDTATIDEILKKIEVDIEEDSLEIVKGLLNNRSWLYIADKIKNTKSAPEDISRTIINYCTGILLKTNEPKSARANEILSSFIMEEEIDRSKLIYLLANLC